MLYFIIVFQQRLYNNVTYISTLHFRGDDFRHVYSQVGELRSMLGSVPTLVMSATLPIEVRDAVFNTLHLDPSKVKSVCKNPDRYIVSGFISVGHQDVAILQHKITIF